MLYFFLKRGASTDPNPTKTFPKEKEHHYHDIFDSSNFRYAVHPSYYVFQETASAMALVLLIVLIVSIVVVLFLNRGGSKQLHFGVKGTNQCGELTVSNATVGVNKYYSKVGVKRGN